MAATIQAAISSAPFSRCLSMPNSVGNEKAKVNESLNSGGAYATVHPK
jgi:hypothetical protein